MASNKRNGKSNKNVVVSAESTDNQVANVLELVMEKLEISAPVVDFSFLEEPLPALGEWDRAMSVLNDADKVGFEFDKAVSEAACQQKEREWQSKNFDADIRNAKKEILRYDDRIRQHARDFEKLLAVNPAHIQRMNVLANNPAEMAKHLDRVEAGRQAHLLNNCGDAIVGLQAEQEKLRELEVLKSEADRSYIETIAAINKQGAELWAAHVALVAEGQKILDAAGFQVDAKKYVLKGE
jgi:hypothetical protein